MVGGTIEQDQGRRLGLTASNTSIQRLRNASSSVETLSDLYRETYCECYIENLQHDIQPWEYLTQTVCFYNDGCG
jgi:hypothetical protein